MEHLTIDDSSTTLFCDLSVDCTPDLSFKEQLSVIIRIVTAEGTARINEYFIVFLEDKQTTGEDLSRLILKKLEELNILIEDCRGQSYDNEANMWSTLKKHVGTTLESWADTRWESGISSVEVERFHAAKVRDALLEVRASTADPAIKIEAQALAEEVGSYRFFICMVVWYDILRKVQTVNKLLQSHCMHLDVAVGIFKKAETSFVSYRDAGFADAQTSAKEICEEMNVEAALKQKRLRTTKRQFSYEAPDEPITVALKNFHFYIWPLNLRGRELE
ncbi:uncharacterized protein [Palaemon carinicauda]|uniref:uncharacterized protein n=1 Tax=Palaemon carinicauda TaxID=392227 RepID=UPI0035B6708B